MVLYEVSEQNGRIMADAAPQPREHHPQDAPMPDLFQVKATILCCEPPIWRRFLLPTDVCFDGLALAVLCSMAWSGEEPYYFRVEGEFIDDELLAERDASPRLKGEVHLPAEKTPLADKVSEGDVFSMTYDLEDFWEIKIDIERRLAGEEAPYPFMPVCIDGARCAPFEGVGGPLGHADFCKIMADPHHPYHKSTVEWAALPPGESYDPEYFTPFDVNEDYALETMDACGDELLPDDVDELREMCRMLMADKLASIANRELMISVRVRDARDERG